MATLPDLLSGGRRGILLRLIANGLGQALAGFGVALTMRQVLDHRLYGQASAQSAGVLWRLAGILAIAALAGALLKWLERVDSERLGQGYARDVRLHLFDHLSRVSPRHLQRWRQGGLVLRFVGDMTALRNWASRGIARLWVAGMMMLGVVAGLTYLSLRMATVVVLVLALGAAATWASGASLDRRVRAARRRQGQLAANINEKLARLPVIQMFGQRRKESRRIAQQSGRLQRAMVARSRIAGLSIFIAALTASAASIGVVLIGATDGAASQGTVLAAITLVALMTSPLNQLGRIAELWRSATMSREKLQQAMQLGPTIVNAPGARKLRAGGAGRVRFDGVVVNGALHAFSALAEGGQRVLVTGANGSGKSTLLALVPRMVEPDQGRVLIDGRDVARVTLGSLRRAVAMVANDLPLLRGDLRMNLSYRIPDAGDDEVRRVLRLCELDELVARLPRGLDTMLSESAANLSVGERRRLMWARALLGNPRVLLLDDIDANLDLDSQRLFKQVLDDYRGTVLMTAQQPDLFVTPDAIWRLPAAQAVPAATAATNGEVA